MSFQINPPIKTGLTAPTNAPENSNKDPSKLNAALAQAIVKNSHSSQSAALLGLRTKDVLSLQYNNGMPQAGKLYVGARHYLIISQMLDRSYLKTAKVIELWGVDIFRDLQSKPKLKVFTADFARNFFHAYISLTNQKLPSKLKQSISGEPYFINSEKFTAYLTSFNKIIKIFAKNDTAENSSFYSELERKIEIGMLDFSQLECYTEDKTIIKISKERIKMMLSFFIDKMELLEIGFKDFLAKKLSVPRSNDFLFVFKFKKELQVFRDSLDFSDLNALKLEMEIQNGENVQDLQHYEEQSNLIEGVISDNKMDAFRTITESFGFKTCFEFYSATRQLYSRHHLARDAIYGDLRKFLDEYVVPSLFPDTIGYVSLALRMFERLKALNSEKLVGSVLSDTISSPLSGIEKEISIEANKLSINLYQWVSKQVIDQLVEMLSSCMNDNYGSMNIESFHKILGKLDPAIKEANKMLNELTIQHNKNMELISKKLEKFSFKFLKTKKKKIKEDLEDVYFKNHLQFINLTLILKDIEKLKEMESKGVMLEEEVNLIPEKLAQFVLPDFELVLQGVITKLHKATVVSETSLIIERVPSSPNPSPVLVETDDSESTAAPNPMLKTKTKKRVEKKPDCKTQPEKKQEQTRELSCEIFKVRRGEKRRSVLVRLRELNLRLNKVNGKGSHVKLKAGSALIDVLPKRKDVKRGIGHSISHSVNRALLDVEENK